jgi:hypothetical protein
MNTEHTSPIEIQGHGVFPQGKDGLFNTVEEYEFECKYAEGFTMMVSGQYPNGVRFEGTDGWVFVTRGRIEAYPTSLLDTVIRPGEIHLYKSDDHKQNFLDCVKTRGKTVAPVDVAHRSIMVGHLGVIAITLGRKVSWDPERERFINDDEANRMLSRPMRGTWHL